MQVWLENIETLFLVGTNLRGGGLSVRDKIFPPRRSPPICTQRKICFIALKPIMQHWKFSNYKHILSVIPIYSNEVRCKPIKLMCL